MIAFSLPGCGPSRRMMGHLFRGGIRLNCLELLLWYLNHTPRDGLFHEVIRHMLRIIHKAPQMTIYELADNCYTSPATISRLVKRLGFKSYAHFQRSLEDSLVQYSHHNRVLPLGQMRDMADHVPEMVDTIEGKVRAFGADYDQENFTRAAQMLRDSNRVMIHGNMEASVCCLQSDLIYSGIPCEIVEDMTCFDSIPSLDAGSTALFVQPKRIDSQVVERAFSLVKAKGSRTIVITNSAYFSILKQADISFVFIGKLHLIDLFSFQMYTAALSMHYRAAFMDREYVSR